MAFPSHNFDEDFVSAPAFSCQLLTPADNDSDDLDLDPIAISPTALEKNLELCRSPDMVDLVMNMPGSVLVCFFLLLFLLLLFVNWSHTEFSKMYVSADAYASI